MKGYNCTGLKNILVRTLTVQRHGMQERGRRGEKTAYDRQQCQQHSVDAMRLKFLVSDIERLITLTHPSNITPVQF